MAEEAVNKKLNRAKKSACEILTQAGYIIERTSNDIYCVMAMRDAEWRAIKIGIRDVLSCPWFKREVRRLECLPCPDLKAIKKEVWLRNDGEHRFQQFQWKDNNWVDENSDPTEILNN